jgi:hypothetical protein
MGVPRHPTNKDSFIVDAMETVAKRHDNLMDLVVVVSEEDPFAALRLLQVGGVNRFDHISSVVPPNSSVAFCDRRDGEIIAALGTIQGIQVDHAHSTHTLLVVT